MIDIYHFNLAFIISLELQYNRRKQINVFYCSQIEPLCYYSLLKQDIKCITCKYKRSKSLNIKKLHTIVRCANSSQGRKQDEQDT